MNNTLISCKNLCSSYEGFKAVDDVSFEVNEGDYLCIVGDNGSGKSTLLKTILKLKTPSGGSITYNNLKPDDIGYVSQAKDYMNNFPASVFEVVLTGLLGSKFKLFYTKNDKKIAMEKLELLGMEDFKNKSFNNLSGGQKQRVLLARALCKTKKIIVLDEPTTGIDKETTKILYFIVELLNKQGVTIITVSHDLENCLKDANKILHMKQKCLFYGTKEEYLNSEIGKEYLK